MRENPPSDKTGLSFNKNIAERELELPCIELYSEFICHKLKDTRICLLNTCPFYREGFEKDKFELDESEEDLGFPIEELVEETDCCRAKFLSSKKYIDFVQNEIPKTLQPAYMFLDKHPENTFQNWNNFIWNLDKKLSSFKLSSRQISRLGRLMWGELYIQILEEKKQALEEKQSEEIREQIMRGEL